MNIFFVDPDPRMAAEALCDIHLRKMIPETCQLLMTTDILHGRTRPWKPYAPHHPCRCALEREDNRLWLARYFFLLCREYEFRFRKNHKCADFALRWYAFLPDWDPGALSFPQVMPDEFRGADTVAAYRACYVAKLLLFRAKGLGTAYTGRCPPRWAHPFLYPV